MISGWQKELNSVNKRNRFLLQNGNFSDCSFLVGENDGEQQVFFAHKLMLASASEVFEKMIFGSFSESKCGVIKIEDIQPPTFLKMLTYIYIDEIQLDTWEEAIELYYPAKKYLLDHLANQCIIYLDNALCASNSCKIFEFANFFDETNLSSKALKIIRTDTIAAINSPNFLIIDISTMIKILEQNHLQSSELLLFRALESLAKVKGILEDKISETEKTALFETECKDSKVQEKFLLFQNFRLAVKQIRFLSMTPEEFATEVIFSKLLLQEEAFNIIACLAQPLHIEKHYPKDFERKKRMKSY